MSEWKPAATGQEWRDRLKSPGSLATCLRPEWLVEGCPKCGDLSGKWEITSDGWAYCDACNWGTAHDFSYLTHFMATLTPDPAHVYKIEERDL